jgi:polyisoprenoid-binding protein YceI
MPRNPLSRWFGALAATALIASTGAVAQELSLQPEGSRLEITFRQMNVPVQAEFGQFSLEGRFDAEQPGQARAQVTIDTTSFDFGPGAEDYNAEARGSDWLNTEQFPQATLVIDGAEASGENRFLAAGDLTIRGTTRPVQVPVTVTRDGEVRVFTGEVTIQRLAFGVGTGDWADTSIVEDDVIVSFTLRSR